MYPSSTRRSILFPPISPWVSLFMLFVSESSCVLKRQLRFCEERITTNCFIDGDYLYDEHKDEDGFLYMTYSGENTFLEPCDNNAHRCKYQSIMVQIEVQNLKILIISQTDHRFIDHRQTDRQTDRWMDGWMDRSLKHKTSKIENKQGIIWMSFFDTWS